MDESRNKRFDFETGETICFKISYKVFKETNGLTISIGLLSGLSRECLTLAHYEITKNKLSEGTSGEVEIVFNNMNINPGEYPLYFELTDTAFNEYSKDVIDDLTPPIIIQYSKNGINDFNKDVPSGFFKVQTTMVLNEINNEEILRRAL